MLGVLALTGCSGSSSSVTSTATASAPCAAGSLVAWSSQEASPSTIDEGTATSKSTVGTAPVSGMLPGRVNTARVGERAYVLATEDVQHDVTHVVDLDVRTCTNRTVRLEGAISPLSMVTDGTRFITTEVVNSTSKIRAFDKTGHMVREQSVSGTAVTNLVLAQDDVGAPTALYGFAIELHPEGVDTYVLLSLDPQTLDVRRRTAIPFAEGSVDSAIAYGDKLVYPLTLNAASNTPGHDIVVLDPDTMKASRVDLGAKLQSVNRATGDGYYYPAGILAP